MVINNLKKRIFSGLIVWVPLIVTIWFLEWAIGFFDNLFTAFVKWISWLPFVNDDTITSILKIQQIPGIGFVFIFFVVWLTGLLSVNILGRWFVKTWDNFLMNIPVIKTVYKSVKQVSDNLFSQESRSFSQAVLVPYPHANVKTIGFVSGTICDDITKHAQDELISVYVPTTPNPSSGFWLFFKKNDINLLDMKVEQAWKYIISVGVVTPESQISSSETNT